MKSVHTTDEKAVWALL